MPKKFDFIYQIINNFHKFIELFVSVSKTRKYTF